MVDFCFDSFKKRRNVVIKEMTCELNCTHTEVALSIIVLYEKEVIPSTQLLLLSLVYPMKHEHVNPLSTLLQPSLSPVQLSVFRTHSFMLSSQRVPVQNELQEHVPLTLLHDCSGFTVLSTTQSQLLLQLSPYLFPEHTGK